MAYRDETEGLRARIAELEGQLGEAEGKLARLERPAEGNNSFGARLLGRPTRLRIEQMVAVPFDEDALGDVMEVLSQRPDGTGQASQVGRRFVWTQAATGAPPHLELTLLAKDGGVLLRAERSLAGQIAALLVSWLLLVMTAVIVAAVATKRIGGQPYYLIPAATLLCALLLRPLYAWLARGPERELVATTEAVTAALERHAANKARIATQERRERFADPSEDEQQAEAEQAASDQLDADARRARSTRS